jgi:hypothetical protein
LPKPFFFIPGNKGLGEILCGWQRVDKEVFYRGGGKEIIE